MKKVIPILGAAMAVLMTIQPAGADEASIKMISEGYVSPSNLLSWPGAETDLVVTDQAGVVYLLPGGSHDSRKVLADLRAKMVKLNEGFDERGLLGFAFHPKHQENKLVYICYSAPRRETAPDEFDHTSHISRFRTNDDRTLDLESEEILMEIDEPQSNHNSGRLAFGPDGMLYISVGDGGAGNDTGVGHGETGNGQNTGNLLGKVLRIDVDGGAPYRIPADNPFAQGGGRPEIYAWGLRNPWGMSFDKGGDHRLFLADVGQARFEEVNIIVKGGNYGWRVREGFTGFDPKQARLADNLEAPATDTMGNKFIDPIIAYKNKGAFNRDEEAMGISITGGYIYRGSAFPSWTGAYIFGDWSAGWGASKGSLFVATEKDGKWSMDRLQSRHLPKGEVDGYIVAFGQDSAGEIYVMTNASNGLIGTTGKVYKIVPKAVDVSLK